jgi:YHS domain-containing protein
VVRAPLLNAWPQRNFKRAGGRGARTNHAEQRHSRRGRRPAADQEADDSIEGIDPVCLMEVHPAGTQSAMRHAVRYAGRTISFCAPSCKPLFLADPAAYLVA